MLLKLSMKMKLLKPLKIQNQRLKPNQNQLLKKRKRRLSQLLMRKSSPRSKRPQRSNLQRRRSQRKRSQRLKNQRSKSQNRKNLRLKSLRKKWQPQRKSSPRRRKLLNQTNKILDLKFWMPAFKNRRKTSRDSHLKLKRITLLVPRMTSHQRSAQILLESKDFQAVLKTNQRLTLQ